MDVIEIKDTTWEKFVEDNILDKDRFIYRGQTNGLSNKCFESWKLISSFNRYYSKLHFQFKGFIGQQLEESLFQSFYGNYKCVLDNNLQNTDTITKLYFLQHYGVPTCLLDFTYDPLIALYFAISNIKGQSGGEYDFLSGSAKFHNDDYYISVFKIDYVQLMSKLNIKKLEHFDNSLFLNYDSYGIDYFQNLKKVYVALDLNPQEILHRHDNYNLSKQASCFILYDNCEAQGAGFEEFIQLYAKEMKIEFDYPIIQVYNIRYNSIYRKLRRVKADSISLFRYLRDKGISGSNLFNDFQGLKYDFNFFNEL